MQNNTYRLDHQLKNTPLLNKLTYNGKTFFHSNSKSKSSSRNQLLKNSFNKSTIISDKDKKIREAINLRFEKSKTKDYCYQSLSQQQSQKRKSSINSVDLSQFAYLKCVYKIELNRFHEGKTRKKSGDTKKNFHIRIKTKSNEGKYLNNGIVSQTSQREELPKNKQSHKSPRTPITSNFRKLISIQLQKQLSTRNQLEEKKQFKLQYQEKQPQKPRLNTQVNKVSKVNMLFHYQL